MTGPLDPALDEDVTSPFAQPQPDPAPPGPHTAGEVAARMRAAMADSNPFDPHDDRKTDGAPTITGGTP